MSTLYLLREDQERDAIIENDARDEEETKDEGAFFCRQCGHQITLAKAAIEVDGGHHHTFFNPAGIVYEIRCFSGAPGCIQQGEPSVEFSWFPGYTWQVALCGVCGLHLGWQFSSNDTGFYGLIAKNLFS